MKIINKCYSNSKKEFFPKFSSFSKNDYMPIYSNGITLIALVVTIVVLLILAGITISALTGKNGIISNAKKAKENTVIGEEKEKIKLAYSSALISSEDGKVSSADLKKEMKNNQDEVTVTVARNKNKEHGIKVIFEKTDHKYFVDGNGNITKDDFFTKDPTAVYWLVYSNNSDDSDLELVFNSTGNVDSSKKLIKKGGNIGKSCFNKQGDVSYYSYRDKITEATIEDEIAPLYTRRWFDRCFNLKKINNIENLYTNNVIDMSAMFQMCKELEKLDLSNFDTGNAIDMRYMFSGSYQDQMSLTEINGLENFDTSNVTDMSSMFKNCTKLTSLDLSSWNTSNVINMATMFYGVCGYDSNENFYQNFMNLSKIEGIENFDTSNVTSMSNMFADCNKLTSLNLSNWNTGNVTNMARMFFGCTNLINLDLSNWDTSNVTDMQWMYCGAFNNRMSLEEIKGIENFNTSEVTDMNAIFCDCTNLTNLDLSGWDTSNVTNMRWMFGGEYNILMNLEEIKGIEKFNTSKVTNMESMFRNCVKLNGSITIKGNVTSYNGMFTNSSIKPNCTFTVNYTSSTSGIVDNIINTKSSNSNVIKGSII